VHIGYRLQAAPAILFIYQDFPMQTLRSRWQSLPRGVVVLITVLAIYVPLSLIVYQSFLSAPFFMPSKEFGLDAFRFIFDDPDFYKALVSGLILAFGLFIIAVPLGGMLAFLLIRTDLPGKHWIQPLILVPVFVSPMVLGFGYVVAAGPVGFFSMWAKALLGFVPWNVYSMTSIVIIAGLTHVPHAYLYISSALRSMGSDVEEAARVAGASPLRVMLSVSLPMVRPALLYASVLLFFLGLEVFGLVLVLGDPEGNLVLATYLYKLTNKLGIPSYHLMAAVAVVLICMTIPLVALQRRLMRTANRFVTVKGKASRARPLPLGKWRTAASAVVWLWLLVTVVVPLVGVVLRAFVSNWGMGVSLLDVLSLDAFRSVMAQPNLLRAIVNSVAVGVFGGALAVLCYTFIGLAMHRKPDHVTRFLDYSVLVPRAVPGLLAGLAFLWVFLFVPLWLDNALDEGGLLSFLPYTDWLRDNLVEWLRGVRSTIFSVWLAYTVVWMAYGLRLISSTLLQVGPELEEAARSAGARRGQVTRHVTVPLARYGLIGSWLLMFLIFEREYSTGVYLLSPGTETIGSMLVSLWAAGAIDIVAALSFINIVLVVIGLGIALRFGVKLHD
jgi:iron(III) transport system permease protein